MISPQGYSYGEDPKADNPFWSDEEIADNLTATATVDNSTGIPSVEVTKSGYNINFDFKNIKGDKGDTGAQGPQGETGATGEAGKDGVSPEVISTGSTVSGTIAGTITGASGTIINVFNGAQGEKGDTGPQGPAGSDAVVPDNVLAEIVDTVTELPTDTPLYDHHAIKETEYGGTQNDVGNFYIARTQITALNSDGSFSTVDQNGNTGTGQINMPTATTTWEKNSTAYLAWNSNTYFFKQAQSYPIINMRPYFGASGTDDTITSMFKVYKTDKTTGTVSSLSVSEITTLFTDLANGDFDNWYIDNGDSNRAIYHAIARGGNSYSVYDFKLYITGFYNNTDIINSWAELDGQTEYYHIVIGGITGEDTIYTRLGWLNSNAEVEYLNNTTTAMISYTPS